MANFIDTSGPDRIVGTDGDDTFLVSAGGSDTVLAGAGSDTITMMGALDASDHIDGGDGYDFLSLKGAGYQAGLVFTATTMVNVEEIDVGDGDGFTYNLTFNQATVAAGQTLEVVVDDGGRIDGSAETDGAFAFLRVSGTGWLTGGEGDDSFDSLAAWTKKSHIDGGGGVDTATFRYTGSDIHFSGAGLRNVEILNLPELTEVVMSDANVAAHHILTVNVGDAGAFDGSAERNGAFDIHGASEGEVLTGGKGADSIDGGQGDDVITGGGGSDLLTGGTGADTFAFHAVTDSSKRGMDHITDLETADRIDLSAIDADTKTAGDQAFHLVAKLGHHAGEATLAFQSKTGETLLSLDVNGDGKADAVIAIDGDHHGFSGFVW